MFEDEDDGEQMAIALMLDPTYKDAADFLALKVSRNFPHAEARVGQETINRPLVQIGVPEGDIAEVDTYAAEVQEKIFWEHSILIGYTVQRELPPEVEDENEDSSFE